MDDSADTTNPDVILEPCTHRDSSWVFYTPGHGLSPNPYIDPEDMKRLQESTGASPKACRKALEACLGDYNNAFRYLKGDK